SCPGESSWRGAGTFRDSRLFLPRRSVWTMSEETMRVAKMVAVVVWLWSTPALAGSRFDVGLLLGSTRATDAGTVLQFNRATTYQATFDVRVWGAGAVVLGIEVPFIASPAFEVNSNVGLLPKEYASLYVTPGLRATFLADRPLAFFVAGGAGY